MLLRIRRTTTLMAVRAFGSKGYQETDSRYSRLLMQELWEILSKKVVEWFSQRTPR